jgi:hypothetical protein
MLHVERGEIGSFLKSSPDWLCFNPIYDERCAALHPAATPYSKRWSTGCLASKPQTPHGHKSYKQLPSAASHFAIRRSSQYFSGHGLPLGKKRKEKRQACSKTQIY